MFFILVTCLLDTVLKMPGEFTYRSLLGVKGLTTTLNFCEDYLQVHQDKLDKLQNLEEK